MGDELLRRGIWMIFTKRYGALLYLRVVLFIFQFEINYSTEKNK